MDAEKRSDTVSLVKVRNLDLADAPAPSRPLHLSAASGLVCLNAFIYVVADDELHLGVFRTDNSEPGRLIRLFDGKLPDAPPDRKKQKPDLEAITLLPASEDSPHGALLVLGSGSKRNRRMGALLKLDALGAVHGSPRAIDLSPLLAPLDDEFAALNIEGALISGGELRLFQRGNKRDAENAIIRFPLPDLLGVLNGRQIGQIRPSTITKFDLGQIDGVPLSFTDAVALPDGSMVFTAVAEDTNDNYNDGPCAGAVVGVIDHELRNVIPLDRPYKVEGVDARLDGDVVKLLLVTDADDANIPASLFTATMKR